MNNLIVFAFAFKEGYNTSIQLAKTADSHTTQMYLQNLFVASVSAVRNNPEDTCLIAVNEPLSEEWVKRFESEGVSVRVVPFTSYVIPKEFPWSLAFFKLCVLDTLVKEGKYDHYLLLDADTYTTKSYKEMWQESDFGVCLYPLGHDFSHPDREIIRRDFVKLYPQEAKTLPITHYGGEYVCGSRANLELFLAKCAEIFGKVEATGFQVENKIGDESVWSIAASLLGESLPIIAGTPYLFRFWTEDFYLTSTLTVSNPVCIWHLPQEKPTGMLRLYRYYMQKKTFPNVYLASKMVGMRKPTRPMNIYTFSNKVRGKFKKWFS